MASETATNVANGISASAAGISSTTTPGTGGGGLQQSGKDLLNREIAIDQRKGGAVGQALAPYQQQVAQGEAQKGIQGLSFAKTLGDVRNRIAQDKLDAREKQAQAGFIGSGAQARTAVEENRKISNTLDTQEQDYTNNLRNLNASIGSARQQELQLGQPLIAKGIARKAATDSSLYNFESDQGIFGKALGSLGKDQTTHAQLDKTKFADNADMQNLVNQFGIDINSADFQTQVSDALAKTLTTQMSSVYDPTIEIKYDDGSGLKTVNTQTRSLSSQILGDILGGLNVAGLAGIVLTGGTSLMASGAAETMEAISAAGEAIGGAVQTIEGIGAGLEMTAGEALGSGFGGVIEQTAGELGVDLGETTGETIGQGFTESIENTLGKGAFNDASAEAVQAAMGAAKETFRQAIQSGASVEEATQMAALNAENMIANSNVIGSAIETGAVSAEGTAGAGVGNEASAGVGAQTQAGVGDQTAAGITPTQAPIETPAPTTPEAPAPTQARGSLLGKAWQGAKTGYKAVAKAPVSVVKTAGKVVLKGTAKSLSSSIGQVYGLSTAGADFVATKVEGLKGSGLSDDTMQTIIKELAEQESKRN